MRPKEKYTLHNVDPAKKLPQIQKSRNHISKRNLQFLISNHGKRIWFRSSYDRLCSPVNVVRNIGFINRNDRDPHSCVDEALIWVTRRSDLLGCQAIHLQGVVTKPPGPLQQTTSGEQKNQIVLAKATLPRSPIFLLRIMDTSLWQAFGKANVASWTPRRLLKYAEKQSGDALSKKLFWQGVL